MGNPEYEQVVEAIRAADDALAKALTARGEAVRTAHRMREASPGEFLAELRDQDCLARVIEQVGTLPPKGVEAIFREVLSACHELEEMRRVLYLGAAGSFAHLAAQRHFGSSAAFVGSTSVSSALDELTRGQVSFLVLPLETSSDGAVTATLHGLAQSESDAHICGEIDVEAKYCLWSMDGERDGLQKVYGTPLALAGCEGFLRRELPRATLVEVATGALAADHASEQPGGAAIGSQILGANRRLKLAHDSIEDDRETSTRYAVVGTKLPSRTGHDRTIIAMAVNDAPGALYASLKPFADRGINLTRLESRPFRGSAWRYMFFLEMDGHVTDRPILTGLEELRSISQHVRILGSYPRSQDA